MVSLYINHKCKYKLFPKSATVDPSAYYFYCVRCPNSSMMRRIIKKEFWVL